MAGPLRLTPDFREFAELLNARSVRYLVVGGVAVGFHGHPRYTGDTGVWIDRSAENAARVMSALTAFGFGSVGVTVADLSDEDAVIQLGYPPNRIDLLTQLAGVSFDACWERRESVGVDGVDLPLIALDDLLANKRALGRKQDDADIDALGG